ncbi:hypothetical protein BSL78_00517 [Apostichopus japonicus]|uniref:Sushi domain-containing protein n=1 Tax=Stichopus japonicus TaxID=307972 RepID=A0A2G8LQL1_STIJA|nr:hypothetical protein BSL78_00517 [Apostichopus japonicus]
MNHGCYGDGNTPDTKILQGVGRYHPYINATGCLEFCLKEGYLLVGISYGCRICYCGELDTNYTMHGRKPDSSCEQNTECHVEPALRIYQVPCPVLSLTNGRVSYKEMTAVFECDGGRSLIGEQKLQCINDNGSIIWDKEQPRCIVESTLPTSSAEISFTTLPYRNLRSPILESTTFNSLEHPLRNKILLMKTKTDGAKLDRPEISQPHLDRRSSTLWQTIDIAKMDDAGTQEI